MTQLIAYTDPISGLVALITPILESGLTIEQIAKKDVPSNVPYVLVNVADLPFGLEFHAAWELNICTPDGYGADYGAGTNRHVIAWNGDGPPEIVEFQ